MPEAIIGNKKCTLQFQATYRTGAKYVREVFRMEPKVIRDGKKSVPDRVGFVPGDGKDTPMRLLFHNDPNGMPWNKLRILAPKDVNARGFTIWTATLAGWPAVMFCRSGLMNVARDPWNDDGKPPTTLTSILAPTINFSGDMVEFVGMESHNLIYAGLVREPYANHKRLGSWSKDMVFSVPSKDCIMLPDGTLTDAGDVFELNHAHGKFPIQKVTFFQ